MKKVFSILPLWISMVYSQPALVDSLKKQINESSNDSLFFENYLRISDVYTNQGLLDSAIFYAELAVTYSSKNNLNRQQEAFIILASIYNKSGNVLKSREIVRQALPIAYAEKDSSSISDLYLSKSLSYIDNQRDSSLFYSQKALRYSNSLKLESKVLRTIALIYLRMGELDKAITLQKELLKKNHDSEESIRIGHLNNLAGFYHFAKSYDSARMIYQKILAYHERTENIFQQLNTRSNLAAGDYFLGNYADVVDANLDILSLVRQHDFPLYEYMPNYLNLAINYRALNQLKKGIPYLDTTRILALETSRWEYLERYFAEKIKYDSIRRDYYQLSNTYRDWMLFQDSTKSVEMNKRLQELQTQFETERKDQAIASLTQQATIQELQLSQRNNQLIISGLFFAVMIAGGLIYYRQDKLRKERVATELEQRLLRSQLNPHFIFNSMTAIQQYMLKEDTENAAHYMGMFSTLMRQILENSREEFITLKEEINTLKNYLELHKVRFNKRFEYEIIVDNKLDIDYTGIPPMFAQPFIENALEHGLFRKEENKITIQFSKVSDNVIFLEIVDTGVGIRQEIENASHKSLAMQITRERLTLLGKALKEKLDFTAENIKSTDGTVQGFRINLTLPFKKMAA